MAEPIIKPQDFAAPAIPIAPKPFEGLYEINEETQDVQDDYISFVRNNFKALRELFEKYARNADDEQARVLGLTEVLKFLNDLQLQQGVFQSRQNIAQVLLQIHSA